MVFSEFVSFLDMVGHLMCWVQCYCGMKQPCYFGSVQIACFVGDLNLDDGFQIPQKYCDIMALIFIYVQS
jgi:hypothetical protein